MQLIKLLTDDDNFFGGDDYPQSIETPNNRQPSSPVNYQRTTSSPFNHQSPARHTPFPIYQTPTPSPLSYQSPSRPTPTNLNYQSPKPTSINYHTSRSIRSMMILKKKLKFKIFLLLNFLK